MCNIFTNSDEVSLCRLIDQAGKITDLKNKGIHIKRIREIKKRLNPFRNIDRSHNIPWRQEKDKKIFISEMKEFILFAETIYKEIIEKIGLSFQNDLVSVELELDEQIRTNVNWMNSDRDVNKILG